MSQRSSADPGDAPSSLVGDGSFDEGTLITPIDEGALCPLESAVQPPFHDASISTVERRLRLLVGAASRNASAFWSKATSAVRNNSYTLSCIAFAVLLAAVVVALVIPFLVSTSGATSFGVLHRAVESTPATSELISNTALVSVPRPPSTEVSMGLLKICCWVVASAFIFEPAWFWFIAFRLPQDTARAITYFASPPLRSLHFRSSIRKRWALGATTRSSSEQRSQSTSFALLGVPSLSSRYLPSLFLVSRLFSRCLPTVSSRRPPSQMPQMPPTLLVSLCLSSAIGPRSAQPREKASCIHSTTSIVH